MPASVRVRAKFQSGAGSSPAWRPVTFFDPLGYQYIDNDPIGTGRTDPRFPAGAFRIHLSPHAHPERGGEQNGETHQNNHPHIF
jgi:hypothetical protein